MMAIRDVPTFDPYAYREFTVGDAARSAFSSWRRDKGAYLAMAVVAGMPVAAGTGSPVALRVATSAAVLVLLVAVVAACVERRVRGLSLDLPGTARVVSRRLPAVLAVGTGLVALALGPALALSPLGIAGVLAGLALGIGLSAPLTLAIPVLVLEGIGPRAAIRRSVKLVHGRARRALPPLVLLVLAAALPEIVRNAAPSLTIATNVAQPLLTVLASIGLGALYAGLHDH